MVDCIGHSPHMVDCLGGIPGFVIFGRRFRQALSLFSLECGTYGRDNTLEECGDGFECGHHVGWFRVE